MSDLIVDDIHMHLGALHVLQGTSFTAKRGEVVALLGASGSGKTTLLRTVAGLEVPGKGRIQIAGTPVFDHSRSILLPPEKRNIGLVFQSYALWPHRTVAENVAFGLAIRGAGKAETAKRVQAMLEKLGLGHLAERYPFQLSGGQQQRVAICRALVYEPKVILLDEPLSNLDAKLREEARYWIRTLILELELCAVMVTHDQDEALAMADNVLLLKNGAIVQSGSPLDIYSNPKSRYTAEFLGNNNCIDGELSMAGGKPTVLGPSWSISGVLPEGPTVANGNAVSAIVRVEQTAIHNEPGPNRIPVNLDASIYLGNHWEYRLSGLGVTLKAQGSVRREPGNVWCELPAESVWIFPKAS
ncbi:ABC transporter ATP-binding protein [Shinella daejeonensis]|uniref:ABC transporter ATP-binding protein n=1 Tax=Shinella daejeonensis TaxID=659017 RepID=UPI0020C751E5|nr:ABC transporter ATP-binding protein [Shinella daejeonensis]MCP8894557.1 ABC transporter ATP-binding protein [Shinella daejeonensis]